MVIQTDNNHALCIELKFESGEGLYPSDGTEKHLLIERKLFRKRPDCTEALPRADNENQSQHNKNQIQRNEIQIDIPTSSPYYSTAETRNPATGRRSRSRRAFQHNPEVKQHESPGVLVGPDGEPEPATAATVARHSDYHKAFVAFFLPRPMASRPMARSNRLPEPSPLKKLCFWAGKPKSSDRPFLLEPLLQEGGWKWLIAQNDVRSLLR